MTLTVADLDAFPAEQAAVELVACCGSSAWVRAMVARRPFGSRDALFRAADEEWARLSSADWLEAFAHHPRIGQQRPVARVGFTAESWSAAEQSRAMNDGDEVRAQLAREQSEYEGRFGHVFLISASGKSGNAILAALRQRMRNDPATELRVAAEEQRKITRLRLEKLFSPSDTMRSATS